MASPKLTASPIKTSHRANEIPDPSRIVVGQALVIPITGSYHWVQPGQSLYIISRLYGMTVNELASINRDFPRPASSGWATFVYPAKTKSTGRIITIC